MCWVRATAERRCEACGDPPTYKEFLNVLEQTEILNLTLGPYDAFHSRQMEGTRCANDMVSDHNDTMAVVTSPRFVCT